MKDAFELGNHHEADGALRLNYRQPHQLIPGAIHHFPLDSTRYIKYIFKTFPGFHLCRV